MADGLPPIQFNISTSGHPVVIVEQVEVNSAAEALRRAPALSDPKWVRAYAQVVNHLTKGFDYEVIMDPALFKATYMEKYNAEDVAATPVPGVVRLHNYALPDFDSIAPPALVDGKLVFFARNAFRGLAYRVTMDEAGKAKYLPVRGAS